MSMKKNDRVEIIGPTTGTVFATGVILDTGRFMFQRWYDVEIHSTIWDAWRSDNYSIVKRFPKDWVRKL